MVMKPGKLQRNKQISQDLQTLHNLLFWAHALGLNYVTATFLLASSSGTNLKLFRVRCRVRAKKANKNIEQRNLLSFKPFTSINYGYLQPSDIELGSSKASQTITAGKCL